MRIRSLIPALTLLLSAGCASSPKPYDPGAVGGGPSIPMGRGGAGIVAQPLTKAGDNHRPVFSPDGKKVLFISENRETHKHLQLYEVDIATRAERRVTFHDGDVNSAIYAPDGKGFIYSSSTDEIKEAPYFVDDLRKRYLPAPSPAPAPAAAELENEAAPPARLPGTLEGREPRPAELYEARIDGSNIRRLTRSPGFDGGPAMSAKGRYAVFSSERSSRRELYGMSLGEKNSDKNARRLTKNQLRDIDPALTPDGAFLAWVQVGEDFASAQILVAEGRSMKGRPLTAKAALNVTPAWHPSGQELAFASNRGDSANFDLFTVDRKGACLKRLTESPSHESFPAFSPDGRKLAFSSDHSGRYQIYIMEYQPPPVCMTDLP